MSLVEPEQAAYGHLPTELFTIKLPDVFFRAVMSFWASVTLALSTWIGSEQL